MWLGTSHTTSCVMFRLLFLWIMFKGVWSEWRPYGQHEYMFSDVEITGSNAHARCVEQNGTLASITDEFENEFIITNTQGTGHAYWLGLWTDNVECESCRAPYVNNSVCLYASTDSDSWQGCCTCRSDWYWIDGSPMDYMNWQHNEPTGGQHCGRIKFGSGPVHDVWLWYDTGCEDIAEKSRYICKRETVARDPTPNGNKITKKPSTDNSNSNQKMFIGVGIGVFVLVIIVVVVVVVVVLRRKRQKSNQNKYSEDHTYYNTAPTISDANHNNTEQKIGSYDNTSDALNNTRTDQKHNYDNNGLEYNSAQTEYAEINTPAVKPPPMKPKPKIPSPQPVSYAELEFETDNPTPHQHDNQFDQYNYSSVDSLKLHGKMSYHQTSDEYAIAENVPAGGNDSPNATPDTNADVTAASRPATMPIYAQPMKNKAVKPAPTSPRVKHVSSPLHQEVLYAVPDKHK